MAIKIFQENEPVPCGPLSVLVYGPPGVGKTTLGQTANGPLVLDFDNGVHRAGYHKEAVRLESWADWKEAASKIDGCDTVVVDTVGRMLDLASAFIVRKGGRGDSYNGSLTQQGWGVLKGVFTGWLAQLRQTGKDIVFLAHEKEDKDGDTRILRPDVQGGSWGELRASCDLMGRLSATPDGGRLLDFNGSDRAVGKNCVGWKALPIGCTITPPDFLARLIAAAKAKLSPAASDLDKMSPEGRAILFMAGKPSVSELNRWLVGWTNAPDPDKMALFKTLCREAARLNIVWDKANKVFAHVGPNTPGVTA